MEAPDVAPPPVVPISDVSPILSDEQPDVGDNDIGKKTRRLNYQNWEVAALIYGCHAACVAKPNSTVQFRSQYLRDNYSKYANQCLQIYGLKEGESGTHTVADSFACRTVLATSGKNKGKSPAMGKYMEMISEVVNNILPLYKKELDSGGNIPSGKTPSEVLMATKAAYYDSRVAANKKLPKEMPVAWTDFAWSTFVMFGPQGKQYAEFCAPTDDDAQPTSRSAALAAAILNRKRHVLESAGSSAMDRVFEDHNNIMAAKMMLKYGGPQDKVAALASIREFLNKGKENLPTAPLVFTTPSHVNTIAIPFTVATPTAQPQQGPDLGPDTGDDVGDDGLTWVQRACKSVYDSKECNESVYGFTYDTVVEKLNGRVSLKAASDATDFLMLECHIFTTSQDHHYKSTTV